MAILDGGLATQLEADGHDLDHPLWSARVVMEAPDAVVAVHERYLQAGADCVIAATYQATPQGLMALGLEASRAEAVMLQAVRLALRARGDGAAAVAASVGPYGATLADGSEFRGDDGLSVDELVAFHRPRWELLCGSGADLLACETVPSLREVRALASLFAEGALPGWISVSCRDGAHLSDGTPIEEVARVVQASDAVWAWGINCTAPRHVTPLLRRCRQAGLTAPAVVYPNSGERFDGDRRCWVGEPDVHDFVAQASEWKALGAAVIGGCCRTGPDHVAALTRGLRDVS